MERILDVVISTNGAAGLKRLEDAFHPKIEGVNYVVSFQGPLSLEIPTSLKLRPDFEFHHCPKKGLCLNRNNGFSKAKAPLMLVADDDVSYKAQYLEAVIEAFNAHPDCDMLFFQYSSNIPPKAYPSEEFDLSLPPKGYYPSSVEMAFRREALERSGICFNEDFGIGGRHFNSGEEDILLHDALQAGLKGRYIPLIICHHPSTATSGRRKLSQKTIKTKGAVMATLHPRSWRLRMLPELRKAKENPGFPGYLQYAKLYLNGGTMVSKKQKTQ